MVSPQQSRNVLERLSVDALRKILVLFTELTGTAEQKRAALLEIVQSFLGPYQDASATLAADLYEELREQSEAAGRFIVDPVVTDRVEKIRRAVAWATEPLFGGEGATSDRLTGIVKTEVFRPYRDTTLSNTNRDRQAVGWKRITHLGACSFCLMLAGRGAVYKEATAQFASHEYCYCSAAPVFRGGHVGPEATDFQYMASRRHKTRAQKDALNAYLVGHGDD